MKITFLGAAKTVTGSCFLVETSYCKFLVDCGMFQGHSNTNALNDEKFPFNPADIEFMILTHAHIDHSGRIPKLYIDGFGGSIITTKATAELCALMLPDSGHIQESEAEWQNRKKQRAGKQAVKPLYTFQDAVDCLKLFVKYSYGEPVNVRDGIRVRFNDAGHILGSSIVELWVAENGEETKAVFSGDLGNKGIPILRDPSFIKDADYVVVESTYGNRLHTDTADKVDKFVSVIDETVKKGGNVVIPSFAVGRTQEIIYDLHKQREKYGSDKLKTLFSIPVVVDSPLAVSATQVFRNNLDCFDSEARTYVENGDNPLDFPGLKFTKTPDESKALNDMKGSMIIISASGMCEAGRIKHHLKHNLWRSDSAVIFVGYQAVGTLGRSLVDGAKKVKIFGEEITVNARVEMFEGFSGHADKNGLIEWLGGFATKPRKVFVVHGEEEVSKEFAKEIQTRLGLEAIIPERGGNYTVSAGRLVQGTEKPEAAISFKRLELLDILETLREELDDLSETIKNDLKSGTDDDRVDAIRQKLKNVEHAFVEVLK